MFYKLMTVSWMILCSMVTSAEADPVSFLFQNNTYARGTRIEYKIQDGRLLEREVGSEWKLQGAVGLPFNRKTKSAFPWIKALKRVYADADCIAVTDQDDRVYFYQSMPVLIGASQPYAWDIDWGQPLPRPLYLKRNFRAVSFSRHTDESLKYMEDALGIPHNAGGDSYLINMHREKKGHSGLTHFYALSEDGAQLFFADSGLPAGITYEYPLPRERLGNPIALASRGSVVALLTDRGEVFTKLLDFDFLGHNPMMYGYRYNPQSLIDELSRFHFTDLTPSHYGTINLPYPDWQKHDLLISGMPEELKVGTTLDMETTGPGIYNRELFLKFKNKKGECGILRKKFAETKWRREEMGECPSEDFITFEQTLDASKAPEKKERPSFHFSGDLRVEGETFPFEISDFDLVNYEARAVIHVGGLPIALKLHTVFTWSPFQVMSPGFDGRPKLFHVTFELPNDSDLPETLRKLHFETFSTWLWGTKDHLKMESTNFKISGDFFSDSNTDRTHFIAAYGKDLKSEEIQTRLRVAFTEKKILYEMGLAVKTSRAITAGALIQYWPRAMDATFPPLNRLLIWGEKIIKQRLRIVIEEIIELQRIAKIQRAVKLRP